MGNNVNSISKPTTPNKSTLSVPVQQHNYFENFEYSDWYPICLEYIQHGKEAGLTQAVVKRKAKDFSKKTYNVSTGNKCLFNWMDR